MRLRPRPRPRGPTRGGAFYSVSVLPVLLSARGGPERVSERREARGVGRGAREGHETRRGEGEEEEEKKREAR